MMSNKVKGKEIRKYFIEVEKNATKPPVLTIEMMYEQYQAEKALRVEAERTKAEIGSRREATSMVTASVAVRKVRKLEAELDKSNEYITIKRMQTIKGETFNWRQLKKSSIKVGIDSLDVFDANYGTVKSYHIDAWNDAYLITD